MTATLSVSHRPANLIRLLLAARDFLGHYPEALIALAFRFAVAVVFWRSGMTKIANWDVTVGLFDMEYMLPLLPPQLGALLAASAELSMPVLLVLGLGTRFAAAVLLMMTLVIQLFVYPENWPDHLLWGSILAYLLTRGAGGLSVDRAAMNYVLNARDA